MNAPIGKMKVERKFDKNNFFVCERCAGKKERKKERKKIVIYTKGISLQDIARHVFDEPNVIKLARFVRSLFVCFFVSNLLIESSIKLFANWEAFIAI